MTTDHVGLGGAELLPRRGARLDARLAERVGAAGGLDHLGHPVAADERWVEPLQARRRAAAAHPRPPSEQRSTRNSSSLRRCSPRSGTPHSAPSRTRSASTSSRVSGSSESTSGSPGRRARDRAHVVVGDGAHGAEGLGHDQVRLEPFELFRVEPVDRLALGGELAHGGVDLAGREAVGDLAPREAWALQRCGRPVALVRDGDDVVAQAEREERLGRGRDEAGDPWEGEYGCAYA